MNPDPAHTDNCQGCVADRLTEADRAHLAVHGWNHPGHTYNLPRVMPPRPRAVPARRPGLIFLGAVNLYALAAANPTYLLPAYAVIMIVGATWQLVRHRRHDRRHPGRDRPHCRLCLTQAARMWAHYDGLRDLRARRMHYADYRRLRDEEQRYRPGQ